MKRRVLVVAAEKFELSPVRKAVMGRDDADYVFVANGPGPRLARAAMESVGFPDSFDAVVSVGLCGALEKDLGIGFIVIAHAVNGVPIEEPVTRGAVCSRRGPIVSVDYVAGSVEEKRRLRATGAIAVEMEAAGVLEKARETGRQVFAIKAVSDTADEGFALDLNAARDGEGRFQVMRILGQAVRSPRRGLPELARLKRNGEQAVKALGDFFAHCTF